MCSAMERALVCKTHPPRPNPTQTDAKKSLWGKNENWNRTPKIWGLFWVHHKIVGPLTIPPNPVL